MKFKIKTWLLVLSSLMVVATGACAEDYPTHAVKLIVGYPAGGMIDSVARMIAQRLADILKQPFVVENKPGASGNIAAAQTAKAAADGYTLFVNDVNPASLIYKDLPYDPIKSFTPVGNAVMVPLILVANSKTGIKTLADLIRQAKASPGTINYGTPGIGSLHHIAMEAFCRRAGIVLMHIPYKGGAQLYSALLSGEVQVGMIGIPAATTYSKSGQFNLLAVVSQQRYPTAPDVPAISEFYKGYDYASASGILAPAGLSPEIVEKLSGALKTALEGPEINERLIKLGLLRRWLSPRDYAEFLRQSNENYKRAIEESHIMLN